MLNLLKVAMVSRGIEPNGLPEYHLVELSNMQYAMSDYEERVNSVD